MLHLDHLKHFTDVFGASGRKTLQLADSLRYMNDTVHQRHRNVIPAGRVDLLNGFLVGYTFRVFAIKLR